MPAIFSGLIAWWTSYYGGHQIVSVTIRFLHLASLLVGGGTALFCDRQIVTAIRSASTERETILSVLEKAHLYVVPSLFVTVITGLLMTTADTTTFLASKIYWTKVVFVGFLLLNGAGLLLMERRTKRIGIGAGWLGLFTISIISIFLWLGGLFLGTLLTVAA
jgi:hypothetical protein